VIDLFFIEGSSETGMDRIQTNLLSETPIRKKCCTYKNVDGRIDTRVEDLEYLWDAQPVDELSQKYERKFRFYLKSVEEMEADLSIVTVVLI